MTDDRRRHRGGEQTSELILSCAEELIHERGFSAVSLRELAQAVGVKAASLYYHFTSKEEMLFAIARRHMEGLLAATYESVAGIPPGQRAARVTALVETGVLYHLGHQHAAGVVINERRHLRPEKRDVLHGLFKDYESIFLEDVAAGMREGAFKGDDPVMATFVMLGAITRLPVWYVHGGRLSPADVAREYTQHLLWSLGAAPAAPR